MDAAPIYRPLDPSIKEIRLLKVATAEWSYSPLVCELEYVSLTESPIADYITVSYCWGDETHREWVTIEGQTVDIPTSSAQVLRRARCASQLRTVWIDALCINQQDAEEKSSQVILMGAIYRNGAANIVYLGEEDEADRGRSAITAVNAVYALIAKETNDFKDTVLATNQAQIPVPLDAYCDDLQNVFSRDWFR